MTQAALFHETLYDALKEVVASAGGAKKVGEKLWPEKSADAAGRQLLDCLNDDRTAKLSPEQVLFIIRLGREVDCHSVMNYLARESGYADPTPIEPEDEKARLRREYIEAVKHMSKITDRMERVGLLGDA